MLMLGICFAHLRILKPGQETDKLWSFVTQINAMVLCLTEAENDELGLFSDPTARGFC